MASVVIGLTALVWPGKTTLAIGVLFGVFLLVTGIVEIVRALQLRRRARPF